MRLHREFKHVISGLDELPTFQTYIEVYEMGFRRMDSTWDHSPHVHSSFEINYVTEGVQIFTINGTEYTLRKGDLILVRPGDDHSGRAGTDSSGKLRGCHFFTINFLLEDPILVPLLLRSNHLFYSADSPVTKGVSPFFHRLLHMARSSERLNFTDKLQIRADVFNLLNAMISSLTVSIPTSANELARHIMGVIDDLIMERFDRESDDKSFTESKIQEIADETGMSVSYCYKVFKKVYQMSPRQYVSFRMLDEAKRLLKEPEQSIEDIAYQLKFYDAAHFSRQFKRWTGLSPSEYRQQNQALDVSVLA